MTILYKLTDQYGYTRRGYSNACLWGPGVSHSGTGRGDLCSEGYIHAYTSPYLAVLLNPLHADIPSPRLWEAVGVVVKSDNGLKVGCVTLKTVKELPLPVFTTNQRVYFALLCASKVYKDLGFTKFVQHWVSGKDRSPEAASKAVWAAWAAWAATGAARAAAEAAARAARAAARADFDPIYLAEKAYEWKDSLDV